MANRHGNGTVSAHNRGPKRGHKRERQHAERSEDADGEGERTAWLSKTAIIGVASVAAGVACSAAAAGVVASTAGMVAVAAVLFPIMVLLVLLLIRVFRRSSGDIDQGLEDCLKMHFENIMKCENVPLLSNFDVYKRSLPVRRHKKAPICLYKLPHWTCDDDMTYMVNQLETAHSMSREVVKYLCAPGHSGKTSCILPAFLKSAEREGGFTHYLYLPFDSNNGRYFRVSDSDDIDESIAEKQGASFICECLEILLKLPEMEGVYEVPCNKHPVSKHDTQQKLTRYLDNFTRPDQQPRILLHLDEHHKMCERKVSNLGDEVSKGAQFCKGAMEALARVPNVTVVATYTAPPPLPANSSSGVCRDPVVLPLLDINTVVQEVLQFPQPQGNFGIQKRLWATLLFRLAMKLTTEWALVNLHHPDNLQLLKDFKIAAHHEDTQEATTKALKKCMQLCVIKCNLPKENLNATKLLLGLQEKDLEAIERQVSHVILLRGNIVSCSLKSLLESFDPKNKIFSTGCTLLKKVLNSNDYLSQTPLEAAYCWVLSCHSAVSGHLEFMEELFDIKCEYLLPGRLFPQSDNSTYNMEFMKPNIIYFAKERKGENTHPLADIFFLTNDRKLVLIDITGGRDTETKKKKTSEWIEREQDNIDFELHGLVLAPFATGASRTHDRVMVVCGEDAQVLLGGLRQVFRWLK